MAFNSELEFEAALINILSKNGWNCEVLKNYTEEQLIQNWADILYKNNKGIDRLNEYPLTRGEMNQILEQITNLRTPLRLNSFINGKHVTIIRDNQDDREHFGKEVSLKIYDRREVCAGQSCYQIVEQPKFPTKSKLLNDRRGDLMLLINGMPVIHIELKKTGVPVSKACYQIEKYTAEGIFTGFFSLVQIFVAMNPEETVYFANPGPEGKFNSNYYFHWADFNNEPINDWKVIATTLLSIPMAHQLIGFYTVADKSDGVLKVMRSYQYYAANAISDKVSKAKWENGQQNGGYIWHTTGSGKTMTSFKSAQLISSSKDADKVIFLIDRIELGTQSLKEYSGFASENENVAETEDTSVLISKLKSIDPSNTLIVTSIQKMSNIKDDPSGGLKEADLKLISSKRIVIIVDECHRSTFGDMLLTIKHTFPKAMFFGFTGTPIQDENQKKNSTTSTVFGDELHRYSIADGIRDKNVLGFDPYKVLTFKDKDLREVIALEKAKAETLSEALSDETKSKIYYEYMTLPMAGSFDPNGNYNKGIEDYLPNSQYDTDEHHNMVIEDIIDTQNWISLSRNFKFHAILATSSIIEAIKYYRLLREKAPWLKTTALFDPNIDNNGTGLIKEDGLVEIITDYNKRYGKNYTIPTFAKMKKDISARLSHKNPYERIELTPDEEIDLLIVVDQMLTGFDSKWINTLYLDKILQYENIIQAFSRTNRLFGNEKPFGTIKYYRRPHTMEKNIERAISLYSGDKPLGLFAERLNMNLEKMNFIFSEIEDVFRSDGIYNFEKIPTDVSACKKFAELFRDFNKSLEAAKVQGFEWNKNEYTFEIDDEKQTIIVNINETTYLILAKRYKELFSSSASGGIDEDTPYVIDGYLTTIDTEKIDSDYMNSRFEKYLKLLKQDEAGNDIKAAEEELHKTFASLSQEEQKFANIFLHDIERGDVTPIEGKTLRDYITEYITRAKDDQVHRVVEALGVDETLLRSIMALRVTEYNINEFGRFDHLMNSIDRAKAKTYFESIERTKIIPPKVPIKADNLLRKFILSGGFDIETPSEIS